MPRGDKRHILEYNCIEPNRDSVMKFNNLLRPMCELIESNINESRKLAEMRDALLPKLMKGSVSVD